MAPKGIKAAMGRFSRILQNKTFVIILLQGKSPTAAIPQPDLSVSRLGKRMSIYRHIWVHTLECYVLPNYVVPIRRL